jgi:hypothetical protein
MVTGMEEAMKEEPIDRIPRIVICKHRLIKAGLCGLYSNLLTALADVNEIMGSKTNETMKDHLANTAVEWLAWSLAKHIQDKFGKAETKNVYKRNKKNNKKKRSRMNKTEEMKEMEKNLRAEMTGFGQNESICHKIWADLYMIRKKFRYGRVSSE